MKCYSWSDKFIQTLQETAESDISKSAGKFLISDTENVCPIFVRKLVRDRFYFYLAVHAICRCGQKLLCPPAAF